jgi:hypothetical protein
MIYDINPHISGDTWCGLRNISIFRNGSALNLSGSYIEMQVRLSIDSPSVLNLTTDNGGIIIETPSLSAISIPSRIVNIPIGNYIYGLKVILPSGEAKTELEGNWPILTKSCRLK